MSFLLDVRRLRLLRDFALLGTVAATAQAQHLTGPAVSQQLAALEKEAGVTLLRKHGRTLRLTSAGQLMVEHAEVILGGLAAAEADLQVLRAGGRGLVRIAAFPSAARTLLPPVWQQLAADPEQLLDLRITESEPSAAMAALRRAETDIAVVHAYSLLPRDLPSGCVRHRLLADPVLFAIAPGPAAACGLAEGEPVDLGRFAEHNWLLPGPETSCHELTQRACGAAGFVPRAVALASDFAVLTALVAAEAGVALVPRMALPAGAGERLRLHPLCRPIDRTVFAVTSAGDDRQAYLRRVLDELRGVCAAVEADTAGQPRQSTALGDQRASR
ncbi:MAG TPA: LysR family transcriptional regulator [Pseudonocardiaceae bacterium]|nr:LysR family transcriptional regulator [Pseudonocardiaceae bacterium]